MFAIPDALSYEEASLVEPFSVGIHAATRTKLQPGSTIAIMGMGPVGLMAVVAARAFGASNIIVTDLEPLRLEAAKEMGATYAINIREQDPYEAIQDITNGKGLMLLGKQQVIQQRSNQRLHLYAAAGSWPLSVYRLKMKFR